MIDPALLMSITIAYPILAACSIVGAGIYLADSIERKDLARLLMVGMFVLFAIRFAILAVSLGSVPAMIDRTIAQTIAGAVDSVAAVLAAPYVAIVVYRRRRRARLASQARTEIAR